jgi:anti-anti-sigma regulatory factor
MATNFRISVHRNSDNLHLKLSGDFDGTSAHEVLNLLKRNCRGTSRVFIHTNALNHIHPFGQSVFRKNLGFLHGQPVVLSFTGEHSALLSPEEN